MAYYEYILENQLDFTHPYMTINQMKKMIKRNYEKPRDFFGYGESSKEEIENLDKQIYEVFPNGVNLPGLRIPILVFPIPTGEMWDPVKYGFIIKYDANGETIVYSPVPIPYLERITKPLSEELLKLIDEDLNLFENPLDKIKEELVEIFEKHNFFELAKNYFIDKNLCTHAYIKSIQSDSELLEFCCNMKKDLYPIFRKKYGRDRKNDGKALLEKTQPFEQNLNSFIGQLKEKI